MNLHAIPHFDGVLAARCDDLDVLPFVGEQPRLGRHKVPPRVAVGARIGCGEDDDAHKMTVAERSQVKRRPSLLAPLNAAYATEYGRGSLQNVESAPPAFGSPGSLFDDAGALATPTSRFRLLLTALDRRLHVVAAALQLAENAFRRHLALQVLDRTLDPAIANGDFEWLAGNGFRRDSLRHGHYVLSGARTMAEGEAMCKALAMSFSRRK